VRSALEDYKLASWLVEEYSNSPVAYANLIPDGNVEFVYRGNVEIGKGLKDTDSRDLGEFESVVMTENYIGKIKKDITNFLSDLYPNVNIRDLRLEDDKVYLQTDSGRILVKTKDELKADIKTGVVLKAWWLCRQYNIQPTGVESLHSCSMLEAFDVLENLENSLKEYSISGIPSPLGLQVSMNENGRISGRLSPLPAKI